MNLLAIETSTEFCSLALSRGNAFHSAHFHAGQRHAELVLGEVEKLLREAGVERSDLEGNADGTGPVAVAGVRIACGVTQRLALARGLRVVGVVARRAQAEEWVVKGSKTGLPRKIVAGLDAWMGEVFH